jgi:hypothetical protein
MSRRPSTTQIVAYTATAAATTNAVGSQTYAARLAANTACHFAIGKSPTATTADAFLPANWQEDITIQPGEKVSFVKAATNGLVTSTDGSAWVTELT